MLLIWHLGGRGRHWSTKQVLNHLVLHRKTFSLKMKGRKGGKKVGREEGKEKASKRERNPVYRHSWKINTLSCFCVVLRKHLRL